MKKSTIDIDPDKEIFFPKIILEDNDIGFDLHCVETSDSLYTQFFKLDKIEISGMNPEDLTLTFGNLGHIHFKTPNQVKTFVKAINEFYKTYLKPMYD